MNNYEQEANVILKMTKVVHPDYVVNSIAQFLKERDTKQKLNIHGVMQAEGSDGVKGSTVGQRSVGTVAEAQALTHGICKERNCNEPATKDYNGHEHWVCNYHYDKLNDEFDEEYR